MGHPKHCSMQCRDLRSASALLAPGSLSAYLKKSGPIQRNYSFLSLDVCLKIRGFLLQGFTGLGHCGVLLEGSRYSTCKVSEFGTR